jgi:hypothetical protein
MAARLAARGDSISVLSPVDSGAFSIQPSPEGDRVLLLGNGNSGKCYGVPEAGAVLTSFPSSPVTPLSNLLGRGRNAVDAPSHQLDMAELSRPNVEREGRMKIRANRRNRG